MRDASPRIPMIKPHCRDRLTAGDFDFVVRALRRTGRDEVSLAELLTDADCRDAVLDHEKLFDAVLAADGGEASEGSGPLTISPQLYFYVLARHVLKRAGLSDRRMADYIASLLEHFSKTARMRGPAGSPQEGPIQYVSDMLFALRTASPFQAFLLRAHMGNYSLFVTGIFHGSVESRSQRGAPDIGFFEEIGAASYGEAAEHRMAKACGVAEVYGELSGRFRDVRKALNHLSDSLITLDEPVSLVA